MQLTLKVYKIDIYYYIASFTKVQSKNLKHCEIQEFILLFTFTSEAPL